MAEDLLDTLIKFHRDVVVPDLDVRFGAVREEFGALRREMNDHFDAIHKRFDRLEADYQSIEQLEADLQAR